MEAEGERHLELVVEYPSRSRLALVNVVAVHLYWDRDGTVAPLVGVRRGSGGDKLVVCGGRSDRGRGPNGEGGVLARHYHGRRRRRCVQVLEFTNTQA